MRAFWVWWPWFSHGRGGDGGIGNGPTLNLNPKTGLSLHVCEHTNRHSLTSPLLLQVPCHRFSQKRWSKRHPGKYRWVLYEMWPLRDPGSGRPAVLVTEQNISQVKATEQEMLCAQQRLEAQLEEALQV